MTGNQQQDPLAINQRLVEGAVDRGPRAFQVMAVQVDDAVGLGRARAQPAIPAGVERIADGRPPRAEPTGDHAGIEA